MPTNVELAEQAVAAARTSLVAAQALYDNEPSDVNLLALNKSKGAYNECVAALETAQLEQQEGGE